MESLFNDGEWVIGGDFNAIKESGERKGRKEVTSNVDMRAFAEFIEESSFVVFRVKGRNTLGIVVMESLLLGLTVLVVQWSGE